MRKLADVLPPDAVDSVLSEVGRGAQTELRRQSLEQALKAGGGAFVLGALIRAMYGMAGSGRPPIAPSKDKGVLRDSPFNSQQYSFPLPVRRREQNKMAALPLGGIQNLIRRTLANRNEVALAEKFPSLAGATEFNLTARMPQVFNGLKKQTIGDKLLELLGSQRPWKPPATYAKTAELPPNPFVGPSKPEGQWWHYPLIVGSALAGGYGGYHVADRIAAAKRHEESKARLETARKEFQTATMGLFEEPLVERAMPGMAAQLDQKTASGKSPVAEKLEGLYEAYKSANWADVKGEMLGTYLSVALPLAATVGYINYQDSKRRQRATLLKQVLDGRAKERTLSSPPEFRAEPIPVANPEAL